jgi:hypothetical protein
MAGECARGPACLSAFRSIERVEGLVAIGAVCAPKQVPTVSFDIQEYCHLSIRLNARGGDESDTRSDHPRVRRFKIINAEEETDPAGELLANDRRLMLAVGACEQNASSTSDGTNNDPPFWPTIIRQRRNVFHELELQDIHKEINCWIVISHNQGDQFEL